MTTSIIITTTSSHSSNSSITITAEIDLKTTPTEVSGHVSSNSCITMRKTFRGQIVRNVTILGLVLSQAFHLGKAEEHRENPTLGREAARVPSPGETTEIFPRTGQSGTRTTTPPNLGTVTELQISFTTRGVQEDLTHLRTIEAETLIGLITGQLMRDIDITRNLTLAAMTAFKDRTGLRTNGLRATGL